MRAVIQRVTQASVSVDGEIISSIGRGLCILLGISRDDTPKEMEYMVRKILNLRVFDDNGQRWKKNVMDKQYEVLCVSQFTLYSVLKGNKPDFHSAMGGEESEKFYQTFLEKMKTAYKPEAIKDGKFAAYMQVHIQNDGPVTINLESPPSNNQQQKQNPGKKVKSSKKENSEKENSAQEQTASNSTEQGESLKLENKENSAQEQTASNSTEQGASLKLENKESVL